MAGKPITRIRTLSTKLAEVIAAGRVDEARAIVAEIRRTAADANLPMPELSGEASEMWLQITEAAPTPPMERKSNEAKMTDDVRQALLHAGELAAGHLRDLLAAPGLFGPLGAIPVRDQVSVLAMAMTRAYGPMPIGAQRVDIKPGELEAPEPAQNIQHTLSVMIRNRQNSPKADTSTIRDVTPARSDDEDAA